MEELTLALPTTCLYLFALPAHCFAYVPGAWAHCAGTPPHTRFLVWNSPPYHLPPPSSLIFPFLPMPSFNYTQEVEGFLPFIYASLSLPHLTSSIFPPSSLPFLRWNYTKRHGIGPSPFLPFLEPHTPVTASLFTHTHR